MTDKLTFSFKGPVTVRIGNQVVDLEKHATAFDYDGRASGKSDQLKGFDAGNGTFFRLKKKADGAVDVIVYGKPEALAKYQFKVGNGDLSKARFAGAGEFRSAAPQARDFSINAGDLAAASRDQLLDRLKLAQHVKTPPVPHSPPSTSANATVQTSANKPSGAPVHAQQSASLEIEERVPARPARRNPAVGFKNLGDTCYLNSTLKTLFASTREATLDSLKAQAGKPPFTIEVGGRKILDEIRIQLIALGEAADDPGKQALVNTALAKLVNLLNHADMSKVRKFAFVELARLRERESPTLSPFRKAESHLDVVRAARRLASEGKPYQDILSSAFDAGTNKEIAAKKAASYGDPESLDRLLTEAQASYARLKAAHDKAMGQLNSEARSTGWASFQDQQDALAWMSAGQEFDQKIKRQNDAPEFGAWLNGIMRISPAAEARFYIKTQIENVWKETQVGTSSRPAESVLQLTPPAALQKSANLSALIQQPLKAEQVELAAAGGNATKRSVIEADLSALKRFAVRIDANDKFGQPVTLTGIDFDAEVSVPMTDQKTGKLNNVVMRPAEVIFREAYKNGAHYYAYLRSGERWDRHDDSTVTQGSALPQIKAGLQPRVIVMEVLRTEPVK